MECVREAVSCSVCLKVFQAGVHDPLSLLCGHTFCRSCLNTIKQTGNFLCPTCRQSHNNVQVEKLPVIYSLLSLSTACPGFMFENCSEHRDNLRYWCCECELPLCSLCLYSGHPQGHNVKLITDYVQERKVALEVEIKLHKQQIMVQQKEVWNRIVKLVLDIKRFRGNSFTLHSNQLGLNQLLSNVRQANSIDSIKHVEKKMKEYSPLVIFEKCEAEASSVPEDAVNETIKIQSTGQDTERREDTIGASKRDEGVEIGSRAVLSCQEGRLLLQCVSHPTNSHIPLQMPSEVFLELSAGGRCFGRVYIRLWCHMRRAEQFMALCLGTLGTSHCGTLASNVFKKNSNVEMIVFESMSDKICFNNLEWRDVYLRNIKAGHIFASRDGEISHISDSSLGLATTESFVDGIPVTNISGIFNYRQRPGQYPFGGSIRPTSTISNSIFKQSSGFGICTREPQDNSQGTPFGMVTSGLNVVKAAAAHNHVTQVNISSCGLVLPEFVL